MLDLVDAGRPVVEVARDLGTSQESIYTWRQQDRIDKGLVPGLTSAETAELTAAKRKVAESEAELAVHRRASELLGTATSAMSSVVPGSLPREVLGGTRAVSVLRVRPTWISSVPRGGAT